MEIIKHGATHQVYTCDGCGCVFEANERDLEVSEHSGKFVVKCPECGNKIKAKFRCGCELRR